MEDNSTDIADNSFLTLSSIDTSTVNSGVESTINPVDIEGNTGDTSIINSIDVSTAKSINIQTANSIDTQTDNSIDTQTDNSIDEQTVHSTDTPIVNSRDTSPDHTRYTDQSTQNPRGMKIIMLE